MGKELWEIGLFPDTVESKAAMQRLQEDRLHPLRRPAARNEAG